MLAKKFSIERSAYHKEHLGDLATVIETKDNAV